MQKQTENDIQTKDDAEKQDKLQLCNKRLEFVVGAILGADSMREQNKHKNNISPRCHHG